MQAEAVDIPDTIILSLIARPLVSMEIIPILQISASGQTNVLSLDAEMILILISSPGEFSGSHDPVLLLTPFHDECELRNRKKASATEFLVILMIFRGEEMHACYAAPAVVSLSRLRWYKLSAALEAESRESNGNVCTVSGSGSERQEQRGTHSIPRHEPQQQILPFKGQEIGMMAGRNSPVLSFCLCV